MAVKNASVAVSTAVAVSTTASDGIGHTVSVAPVDGTVYAGGDNTVTSSNGFPITPSTPQSFALGKGDSLYLVAASGTVNVRVIRVGADS